MSEISNSSLSEIAARYFRLVDAGDPAVVELFASDAELFYPRLGFARGVEGIAAMAQAIGAQTPELHHDIENFVILEVAQRVAVFGRESGMTAAGAQFPDGKRTFGLFANLFEFDGERISRLLVHVDPDFDGNSPQREQ